MYHRGPRGPGWAAANGGGGIRCSPRRLPWRGQSPEVASDDAAREGRTVTTLEKAAPARRRGRPERSWPVGISLLALALGGFAIGTTEFATMGLLPDIAGDLGRRIPHGRAPDLGVRAGRGRRGAAARGARRAAAAQGAAARADGGVRRWATCSARWRPASARCSSPGSPAGCRTARTSASPRWSRRRWWHRSAGPGRSPVMLGPDRRQHRRRAARDLARSGARLAQHLLDGRA